MLLILLLLLVGAATGILSGMLGIGGGLIFTPVLYRIFLETGVARPELWAIGTSLFCTFASSLGGTLRHWAADTHHLRDGIWTGAFGLLGTLLGAQVSASPYFQGPVFTGLVGGIIILSVWKLARTLRAPATATHAPAAPFHETPLSPGERLATGTAGGLISTLAGIGGGLLMVPILHSGFKRSYKMTVSLSETAIVVISLGGWLRMHAAGYVDFAAAWPLVVGSFLGAMGGVYLHDRIAPRRLKSLHLLLMLGALAALLS